MAEVAINPPAHQFGRVNAILNARGTRHHESEFTGPLSIKSVVRGSATWETRDGRYELVPGSVLLLNDGEEYSITVDALQPVETFCIFFERGFVEDAFRATTTRSAELLDAPDRVSAISFYERLHFGSPLVDEVMRVFGGVMHTTPLSESFYALALQLVRTRGDVDARVAKLPSVRATTRDELARRLEIATSYLHANCTRGVTVAEAARAACLSPFHFHRLFTRFHGVTPHRYLNRLRLERARAQLRHSDCNVLDVAVDCGFESLGSFAALYKRTFGVTPGFSRTNRTDRTDRTHRTS
jgi:AraC family transcriptional regulator